MHTLRATEAFHYFFPSLVALALLTQDYFSIHVTLVFLILWSINRTGLATRSMIHEVEIGLDMNFYHFIPKRYPPMEYRSAFSFLFAN